VAQEIKAQSDTVSRAFDDARNIRDTELRKILVIDCSDNRVQCRKRVACDFGARIADVRQKRGFACVGEPDQACIRNDFQFEAQAELFAGLARRVLCRHLMG